MLADGSRTSGAAVALTAVLLLSACTAPADRPGPVAAPTAPPATAGPSAPPALTPTPGPTPAAPEVLDLPPSHLYGVAGITSTRLEREPDPAVVGKDTSDGAKTSLQGLVVVVPLPDPGTSCLLASHLRLDVQNLTDRAEVAVYPGAATSLARGALPPGGQADAAALVDNRPRGLALVTAPGPVDIDVTELHRVWAQGGPFPSRNRTVPPGTPLVLVVRPPGAEPGSWRLTLAGPPTLRVQRGSSCDDEPLPPPAPARTPGPHDPPVAEPGPLPTEPPPLPPQQARWRLAGVPDGFTGPRPEPGPPSTHLLRYLPVDGTHGERISVLATTSTVQALTSSYEVLDTVPVRGGREATYFSVGSGPSARRALVWEEAAGLRLAVYAHTDLAELRRLAESVQPCAPPGC